MIMRRTIFNRRFMRRNLISIAHCCRMAMLLAVVAMTIACSTAQNAGDCQNDISIVPPEALNPKQRDIDLAAELTTGKTTISITLLYYRAELVSDMRLFVNDIFGEQNSYAIEPDTTGRAIVSFLQSGTAEAFIVNGDRGIGGLTLSAGEHIELYADMRVMSDDTLSRTTYHTGRFAHWDTIDMSETYYGLDLYTGTFCDYRLSSADYAAFVVRRYREQRDAIDASDLSPEAKRRWHLRLKEETLSAMSQGDYLREHNYMHETENWDRDNKLKNLEPLTREDAATLCREFDVTDPALCMQLSWAGELRRILSGKFDWVELARGDKPHTDDKSIHSLISDLRRARAYLRRAKDGKLIAADISEIQTMDNGDFISEALQRMQADQLERLSAKAAEARVEITPQVAPDKLFDAIIAPHKGKVVVVDFWATWCAPCREAIKAIAPYKTQELAGEDIVWIYLADETSPQLQYRAMAADIRGLHYYLAREQYNAVCEKFGIRSIPSYVIADREGRYKLRNDLRDTPEMVAELKRMVGE